MEGHTQDLIRGGVTVSKMSNQLLSVRPRESRGVDEKLDPPFFIGGRVSGFKCLDVGVLSAL